MNQVGKNKKKAKISLKSKGKTIIKRVAKIPSTKIQESIIKALAHNEAEDGLYFRNFFLLHEEDQRPSVRASTKDIIDAMNQLIEAGKVRLDYDELEVTFKLAK